MKFGRIVVCITLLLATRKACAQSSIIVYGTIKDANSGEAISGVSVLLKSGSIGVSSNSYGFYSIKIPAASRTLVFSSIGYESHEKTVKTESSINLDVWLQPTGANLKEVV